jgi:pilus assembly protein CpaE
MSQNPIRVLLVDDIADLRHNMEKLLLLEADIEVIGSAGTGEEGIELAKRLKPDVVIMDINMPGIDGITAAEILNQEVPGVQIIMMSVQGETDYMRRSMLAGAREFLIKPATSDEIVTSIRRVYKLKPASLNHAAPLVPVAAATPGTGVGANAREPEVRRGEVIAVFGTKGGVGTSSIATNIAVSILELDPHARIAMLDGNTEFGDLTVLLNLTAKRTIVDLLSVEELDPQFVEDLFTTHATGIRVIPGSSPAEAELVTGEQIKRVLKVLRERFDFIVVDTRPTFMDPVLTLLDHADTIVLVTTADIPSIRNARLFFEVTEQLGYKKDKIKLIVNKYERQGSVSSQAIQGSVKHPVVSELPRDDEAAGLAIQRGLPTVIGSPKSPLTHAYRNLARSLTGLEAPVAEERRQTQARKAPAKKKSLLARIFGR